MTRGVIDIVQDCVEHLREFESLFEKTFSRGSVAPVPFVLMKIRDTIPFSEHFREKKKDIMDKICL
jgi:hypothetical protein